MNNVEELKAELAKLKAAKEAVKNGGVIDPNTLETISKEKTASSLDCISVRVIF